VGATHWSGNATRAGAVAAFEAEGCSAPRFCGSRAGDRYGTHDHTFHKVLFCLSGSIVFHTDEGDIELTAGDRLDIKAGTSHSATVGPHGCECVEASQDS
jgi:quercetin dioxygenase-like cupin family protein